MLDYIVKKMCNHTDSFELLWIRQWTFRLKWSELPDHRWNYQLLKNNTAVCSEFEFQSVATFPYSSQSADCWCHLERCFMLFCVSVMILAMNWIIFQCNSNHATRAFFSWLCSAKTVCARSQEGSYTSGSSSLLFRVLYIYCITNDI